MIHWNITAAANGSNPLRTGAMIEGTFLRACGKQQLCPEEKLFVQAAEEVRCELKLQFRQEATTVSLRIKQQPLRDRLLTIRCHHEFHDTPVVDRNVMGMVGRQTDRALPLEHHGTTDFVVWRTRFEPA
jgi:hypothetical protein